MPDGSSPRHLHGSCHCDNIRFEFDWPGPWPAMPVRACGCRMCTKHRGVWTSHPEGRFSLEVADEKRVTRYRFGTETADFHVCTTCGVVPIVICVLDGVRYAVVNVNTLDGVYRSQFVVTPADFEGETMENRLTRRRQKWTPEATDAH